MESVPEVIASASESTNCARLCRLLVDVGCTVLCDTFDSIHPPTNLQVVLSRPSVLSTLHSLRKRRVLNPLQWVKLFPSDGSTVSSAEFDIGLLVILLKHICGLSPPIDTGSWNKLPPDSDNSTEANIVRIMLYRNDVFGHATTDSVDKATFIALWQNISNVILALASGTNYSARYKSDISQLKTAKCMDPNAEARYKNLLTDWKEDDDRLKEMCEELKKSYQGTKEKVAKKEENVKMQEDSTDAELEMAEEMPKSSQGKSTDTLDEILGPHSATPRILLIYGSAGVVSLVARSPS